MLGNFNEEAQLILTAAKDEMISLKHPYVGTEHLVLSILKSKSNLANRLNDYGLNYDKFKEEIIKAIGIGSKDSKMFLYTPLLKKIIENAIIDAKENNDGEVTTEHLFSSLLEEGEGIAIRIFLALNLDLEEMYDEFSYKLIKKIKRNKKKKLLIEELGINLTEKAKANELDPVIGRDEEIKRVLEVLCRRTKNNPILIGEAGVGKTAIVEEVSRLIASNKVPNILLNKKIISLDMASAVAGTKYRGEFEERMKKILKEIEENNDIILFIDEIHTLVGAGGAEGAIDASNILKPALARGKIRCIGATTIYEYKKFIEKDSALDRRFQKVMVEEPNLAKTKEILLKLKPIYEKFHKVEIDNEILDKIITLSDKYIYDRNQPDKAIDILDEVCSKVSLGASKGNDEVDNIKKKIKDVVKNKNTYIVENKIDKAYLCRKEEVNLTNKLNELMTQNKNEKIIKSVTLEDVADIIYRKTKIPVYEILQDNVKVISEIETKLRNKIIGQDKAIESLVNITKKIKLGYKDKGCYSILFVGNSGVGKSLISKTYAEAMVGKQNFIRLDMSEYADATAVNKIIGSSPGYVGYDDNRNVLEEVRNKPYSVILLDEIDKAHPRVINLFYQILDEGYIKDSKGIKVCFDNCIILLTSNVGFEENVVGFNNSNNKKAMSALKGEFKKAFINRIDNIIVFNDLDEDNIIKIVENKIKKLKLKYRNVKISVSKTVIRELVDLSEYKDFGARKLDKIIASKLENIIIDGIINNKEIIKINKLKLENYN